MFGVLQPADMAELAAQVVQRRYPRGHNLCYAGDPVTHVFLVRSGQVALTKLTEDGRVCVIVTYSPNDLLGAALAVLDCPFDCTASALVDSEILLIPRAVFCHLFWGSRELVREVIRESYLTLDRATRAIAGLATKPATARMADFLLAAAARTMTSPTDKPVTFELALTHQEIALVLGTTRETVTRALARLAHANVIAVDGRRITILRPQAIEQIARAPRG